MVDWGNQEEVKKYHRERYNLNRNKIVEQKKIWRLNNPERWKEICKKHDLKRNKNPKRIIYLKRRSKEYYLKNRKFLIKKATEWKKNNKGKVMEMQRKYREREPEKYQARNYSENHKQIGKFCEKCNSTKNLHFHHINYKGKKGVTLCHNCHWNIHGVQK